MMIDGDAESSCGMAVARDQMDTQDLLSVDVRERRLGIESFHAAMAPLVPCRYRRRVMLTW